jgi:hypothetical protein
VGLYCTFEAVKLRLVGKVRFTESDADDNKMSVTLANNLIAEAEGQVEMDLSPRYAAPFQTDGGKAFALLPERPTKQYVRTLCELQSVMRILETDFGSGTATNGDKYLKVIETRYRKMVDELLERKRDKGKDDLGLGFKFPPLPGLRRNYMNEAADDGFAGQVLVASGSPSQGYAKDQINSPGQTLWWDPFVTGEE